MNLQEFKDSLPEYAKDTKLNLSSILLNAQPGLSKGQTLMTALATAYGTKQVDVVKMISGEASELSEAEITAAKAAASIMAMNNVYYRSIHLLSDNSYGIMPAKLRMSVIANSGVDKVDFELMSLAVSALNGCGMCLDAHEKQLIEAGVSKDGIQSVLRITSVINAAAQAAFIEAL